jgi:plasmid maintenance system antidote protein VapI
VPRFVDLLRGELLRRSARNPRYSLRAFAKFLDVDPATLSQLLRGQRACTPRTVRRLGVRLGLDEATLAACDAAEAAAAALDDGLRRVEELARDTAALAGEWTHHAILDLARRADFVADSRRVAAALGITVDEVNVAVQRLARLGVLELRGPRWIVRGDATPDVARAALRRLHDLIGRLLAEAPTT